MNINKFASNKMKELRIKNNITQQEMANELKVSQQQINRYENGLRQFKLDFLYKLAEYFDISINDFFPTIEEFGSEMIVDEMENKSYTINQLAIASNINVKELKNMVNETTKIPKPSNLIKIGKALDTDPIDYFIGYGYLNDPVIKSENLFDTGIRYLLDDKERRILCEYLSERWNSKTHKKEYTPQKVYESIFYDEKNTFTKEDVNEIIQKYYNFELKKNENIQKFINNMVDLNEKELEKQALKKALKKAGFMKDNEDLTEEEFNNLMKFVVANKDFIKKNKEE